MWISRALKTIPSRYVARHKLLITDLVQAKRLIHEIQVWSPLDHQNVVRFYGWILYESKNTERPTPSLVSSWCEGGNILTFLGVRRPTGDKRLLLIQGIAKGLDYLHSQSVVHGDIKPDNVVVDGNDVPRLCDFGTSSTNQPNRRILRQTHTMTLRYAAPELLMDESSFRCAASDVWAFGCTAMQILCGKQPYHFVRDTEAVICAVEVKRSPFEPRSSTPMEEILSGCLDYDPHRRPDIETLLDGLGIPSEETLTPFPELVKLLLREPTAYWANGKDYGIDDSDEIVRTSPHLVLHHGWRNRMGVRIKTLRELPITGEWERRDFVRVRWSAQLPKKYA
ncbi:kinase-like domain-containing protein [Cantharellus anzutake]|uniref:kinase-like domain-containing protein n=1 Tax=Cantharellus anzutake TaxID=1750568 RepID=UPI001906EBF8|nr:kinase-like domain-containing protein [Cantharellus anzutake]KAF8323605.1 kinase-like domain-containing protein [Cantharellus anzutake]